MGQWDEGPDWLHRARSVCNDKLMADIVNDNRTGPSTYSSPIATPQAKRQPSEEPQKPYTHGWVDPTPLRQPEGLEHVDRLVDMQDKIDAAARAQQMGLSHEEWVKMSEKNLKERKERQEKKLRDKGPQK